MAASDRVGVTPTSVLIRHGKGFSDIPLRRIARVDFYPAKGKSMGAILFIPDDRPTPPTINAAVDAGLGVFFSPNEEDAFRGVQRLVEEGRLQAGAQQAEPAPWVYVMRQIPPGVFVNPSSELGNEAAVYLQQIVNEQAELGWEFYRIDSFAVTTHIGGLLSSSQSLRYYVVTFRKPRAGSAWPH